MLDIALSKCPNDTFLFYGLVTGKIGAPACTPHFADIETLNEWALEKRFPLIKLSMSAYTRVKDHYAILPVGAALGFAMGPKLIAAKPLDLQELDSKTIALPGQLTSAAFLFKHFFPKATHHLFCRYDEIEKAILTNQANAGVIIHETRFSFVDNGLVELADLGSLWHRDYHLPLPLGVIAISRDFSPLQQTEIASQLKASLEYSQSHRKQALEFASRYSIEKKRSIIESHIALYVNEETKTLSNQGWQAINFFLQACEGK